MDIWTKNTHTPYTRPKEDQTRERVARSSGSSHPSHAVASPAIARSINCVARVSAARRRALKVWARRVQPERAARARGTARGTALSTTATRTEAQTAQT